MKRILIPFFLLAITVSGCRQEENQEILPQFLNGSYTGEVTYVYRTTLERHDSLPQTIVHKIAFKLDANKFYRPECGCNGSLSIDSTSKTAVLTSPDKDCIDSGSSNNSSWAYSNDMIGKFSYQMSKDSLTLTMHYSSTDIKTGSPVYSEKIISVTR